MTYPPYPDVSNEPPHAPHQIPAGWYQDPQGQIRWWDGYAWGTATQVPSVAPTQVAGRVYPPNKVKPSLSKLSVAAASLTVLAWLFWLFDAIVPRPVAERCETQECWNALAEGTLDLTPEPTLFQFLGRLVIPMLLTAIGLAIAGLLRSSKRPLPLAALILPGATIVLMMIPVILMILGFTLVAGLGMSGQLGG